MNPAFHNTLTRAKEPFRPLREGRAGLYTCGPTVHDFAHIGNFRAYLFEDLLRRTLRYAGFAVTQVMNLTDVDDKTIRKSRAAGLALREYTRPYEEAFFRDLETLKIERAEHYPRATDHIGQMIALIRRLEEKGAAYRSPDGSVYFRIAAYPKYGELARLDLSGLKAGARVEQDEYEKEAAGDFALWKAWREPDGPVAWDSPWGRGRPGWHIECSAMSMEYLGESFDIHTGGVDNLFPHHEDERAQSEAATGKPYVRTWIHCAHLQVDGRKMAKSSGNFHTLPDLLGRGYSGREIRYALMSVHYRAPLNFTWPSLDAARAALARLDGFAEAVCAPGSGFGGGRPPPWAADALAAFETAMADDLNISGALAALFDMIREGNRAAGGGGLSASDAGGAAETLRRMDRILGILDRPGDVADPRAAPLVEARERARSARQWAEADRIRDKLAAMGWQIRDTPKGPELKRIR